MNKEQILAAAQPKVTEATITTLGQVVRFRALTGEGRDAIHAATRSGSVGRVQGTMIIASVVDENDAPMFSADDMEDILKVPCEVLNELAEQVARINGMEVAAH